jgi:hypothetical protein
MKALPLLVGLLWFYVCLFFIRIVRIRSNIKKRKIMAEITSFISPGHVVALGAQAATTLMCNIITKNNFNNICTSAGVIIHEAIEPIINSLWAERQENDGFDRDHFIIGVAGAIVGDRAMEYVLDPEVNPGWFLKIIGTGGFLGAEYANYFYDQL